MSNNGFIKLPRSLLEDPLWKSLPYTYRHIYLTILAHVVFKPTTMDDFGVLVNLVPGQILITERKLVDLCDEPDIDKSLIHRALEKFKLLHFSNQTSNHRKTIITITRKDILDLIDPKFEPNSNQTRTIKEECKECKEDIIPSQSLASLRAGADNVFIQNNYQTHTPNGMQHNLYYQDKNSLKNEQKNRKSNKLEEITSDVKDLTALFLEKILSFKPDMKTPNIQTWEKQFDKMLRLDNRTPEKVREIVEWLPSHHFWRRIVLSPSKLREKFDTLQLTAEESLLFTSKESILEKIKKRFVNGERYRGYECNFSEKSISFTSLTGQAHYELKLNENGFWDQLDSVLRKLGIN